MHFSRHLLFIEYSLSMSPYTCTLCHSLHWKIMQKLKAARVLIVLMGVLCFAGVFVWYDRFPNPLPSRLFDCARRSAEGPTAAEGVNLKPLYVHYIRFKPHNGNLTFRFLDYLSVMSAVQRLQPDGIFVHGDYEPTGPYWEELKQKGYITQRPRTEPKTAGQRMGKPKTLGWKENAADMVKLDVMLELGGVSVDFDVFFVRGDRIREILRRRRVITCYGDEDGYNMGFMAGWRDSRLLAAWRRSYTDIYVKDWNFNQAFVSKYLSVVFRDEVYVANHACNNPHPDNLGVYFNEYKTINWTHSLAIHSYERLGGVPVHSPADLAPKDGKMTTHKEMLTYIYENRTLPPYWEDFNDEMDPLTDKLKPRNKNTVR